MTPSVFWRAAAAQTRLNLAIAETLWSAAFVIPARLMQTGRASATAATTAAMSRAARDVTAMATEKVEAAVAATTAAAVQAASGRDATVVALASVAPVRRRVRANVKRLSKPTP